MVRRCRGDEFDKWVGKEDELREAMIAQADQDLQVLFDRGIVIPPWRDSDVILDKSQRKLLTRIADNGGYFPYDKDEMRQFFSFRSVVNVAAVVNGCLRNKFITIADGILNITHYGMGMLEAAEEDSALFAGL